MSVENKDSKKAYNQQARPRTAYKLPHQTEANLLKIEKQVNIPNKGKVERSSSGAKPKKGKISGG